MTSTKVDSLSDEIINLKYEEVAELMKVLGEKLDIPLDSMSFASSAGASGDAEDGESGGGGAVAQTEFSIVLEKYDDSRKISIIKVVREVVSGLGLTEAKKLVESAPAELFKDKKFLKDEADEIKKKLEEAGAIISLK